MRVRIGDAGDFEAWNEFVDSRSDATPYHLMHWALAVECAYGHRPYSLIAEREGEITGVLPLSLMRLPLGRMSLCSLPYCDVGGCLVNDESARLPLIEAAQQLAAERGATVHIRSRANVPVGDDEGYEGKVSMLLPLPDDSEILFSDLKAKVRSQVRKAEKNGLTFRSGRGPQELDDFYAVFAANMRDLGSPVHSRRWFESVLGGYRDNLVVGIVSLGNRAVGAGMVLTTTASAAIPWASTLAEYNRLAPNMMLYWRLLEYSIDQRCTVFDFGRSSYGEGTFRFKKQWGATPVPLQWRDYGEGREPREVSGQTGNARKLAASVWRKLPLPVANALGPRIRKYVSL